MKEAVGPARSGVSVKSIMAWAWSVLAILTLPAALSDDQFVVAMLFAISACVAFPPLWRFRPAMIPSRAWFWIGLGAALIGFAVLGANTPTDKKERVPVKTGGLAQSAGAPAAAPAVKHADAKGDFLTAYRGLLATVRDCDKANSEFADYMGGISQGRGSLVDAYRLAKTAHSLCQDSSLMLGRLNAPSSLDATQKSAFADAADKCEKAYLFRTDALATAMAVLDGDFRPSKVSEFTDSAQTAQAGILLCVAQFIAVGGTLGIEAGDLN